MKVLVTAASRHGATAELATEIGARLREAMVDQAGEVEVRQLEALEDVAGYDAVVLGSAVYLGQWLSDARDFLDTHAAELADRPVWLFSSGPVGEPLKPTAGKAVDMTSVLDAVSPVEHRVFAGKIDRHELGLAERAVVRALRVPAGDFRDWAAVREWAVSIARVLSERERAEAVS